MRATGPAQQSARTGAEFQVADHVLIKCIGNGSYGTVFLAQNALGDFRAVKVISRDALENDEAFERELHGLRKFEPLSRSHPGLLNILQVGHDPAGGYFYYVMELGDPFEQGPSLDSEQYVAKTLDRVVRTGPMSVPEILELGLRLGEALQCLHKAGLVHRDLKPSNILFVKGEPKLADVGMVTDEKEADSIVGTLGYIPPEGPGSVQADLFALGRVLYESLTGKDRCRFPDLPSNLGQQADPKRFLELNEVLLKAGHPKAPERYQSAAELCADLKAVKIGKSLARLRELERKWKGWRNRAMIFSAIVAVAGIAGIFASREQSHRRVERERIAATTLGASLRATDDGDYIGALKRLAELLENGSGDARNRINRLRFNSTLGQIPKLTFLKAFGTEVEWCLFLPGDQELLVGLGDGTAQVLDLASGRSRVQLIGHSQGLMAGALSADGRQAATGAMDFTARLWALDTGRQLHELRHSNFVTAVTFHPDGTTLLTACADGWLRWWDRKDGTLLREVLAHSGRASSVAISRDGKTIISGGRDNKVQLWDATGRRLGEPFLHPSWVTHVALSPDDKRLLATCADNNAYLWDLETRARIGSPMPHNRGVPTGEFNSSGRYVMTCSWDGTLCLWNAQTSVREDPVLRQNYTLTSASFSKNGRRVAAGGVDGVLRVWDYAGRNLPERLAVTVVSGNQKYFAHTEDSTVFVQALGAPVGTPRRIVPDRIATPAAVSDDGRFVGLVSRQRSTNSFRVWDMVTDSGLGNWMPLDGVSINCSFVPNQRFLAAWQADNAALRLVSLPTGEVRTMELGEPIRQVAFSSDSRFLAIGAGNVAHVYDMTRPQDPPKTSRHSMRVEKLVFSPGSDRLAVCTSDGSLSAGYVQVWNLQTGPENNPKLWHDDGVTAAAWFPDGTRLATTSEDGKARVWDLATWRQLGAELNHRNEVVDVDLKGEELLLISSRDKFIRMADAQSVFGAGPPVRFPNHLLSARWLPQGLSVMARQYDGQYWTVQFAPTTLEVKTAKRIANTLAGRVQPRSGLDPYDAARLLETEWRSLKAACPSVFTTSLEEVAVWCRVEGQLCRQAGLSQAELSLLNQLLECRPNDSMALSRKGRLERGAR